MWVTYHQHTIAQSVFFLLFSVATGSVRRTFFGTLPPRSAFTTARSTSRLKWLGRVEKDVRAGRSSGTLEHRGSGHRPPHLAHFVFLSDPFRLPTSSGEIGTSLLPCASPRSPSESLFMNHNKGVVPTMIVYDNSAIEPCKKYMVKQLHHMSPNIPMEK